MKKLLITLLLLLSTQANAWYGKGGLTKEERDSLEDYELVLCSLPTSHPFGYGKKNYIPVKEYPVAQCEKLGGYAYSFAGTRKAEWQKKRTNNNKLNSNLNF